MKLFLVLVNVFLIGCVAAQSDNCVGRCDTYVDHTKDCQCNSLCTQYGDCCLDYVSTCNVAGSCAGKCVETGIDTSASCQCNAACSTYNDCCSDYDDVCNVAVDSCVGKCNAGYDSNLVCQCNSQCPDYNNCCYDYDDVCAGVTTVPPSGCVERSVSNNEILSISKQFWDLDFERFSTNDVTINEQSTTSDSSTTDQASEPFFTYVNEAKLASSEYQAFIDLLDNYNKVQGNTDSFTAIQHAEIDHFLDMFLQSDIGQILFTFLDSKGLAGCDDLEMFKEYLFIQWFELFSRKSNGIMDTSGFEHVFVGEVKGSSVSGFHNWVQFYLEEKSGRLDYYGYVRMQEPDIYGAHFFWEGLMKGLSGSSIGTGPFYELAVLTLCHMTRPGQLCQVSLEDHSNNVVTPSIQTWTWTNYNPNYGLKYVASAYFKI